MTSRTNEHAKVFHSVEELKMALFPNMPLEPEHDRSQEGELDEADSLAEKLIHDLMTKPKNKDA